MEEKNRFSRLLEQLMTTAEIKNYTLAQELKYDVSYISKWVNGRIIPAEKAEKKVLRGISHCIVNAASGVNREILMQDYQVDNTEELEGAIYDNLEVEYNYVKKLQKNIGTSIAPKTFFYAELALSEYISQMHHPVLRRVKSLDIIAVMDLMAMDYEYRSQIWQLDNMASPSAQKVYNDVHFSMLIDLEHGFRDCIYDTVFLLNVLTNLSHVDFQLYSSSKARGKIVFAVKDEFSISGMLIASNRCMSVVVSEEVSDCNSVYHNAKDMCNPDMLLFRRITMKEMLSSQNYVRTLLAPNLRWLFGHMTEHFVPDDLFEELVQQLPDYTPENPYIKELRKIHALIQNIIRKKHVQLIMLGSSLSELVVSSQLDFYDHKMSLSTNQRLRYIENLFSLIENNENLEIRLIHGQFIPDLKCKFNRCIFLSDTISYLQLDNYNQTSLLIVNQSNVQDIFNRFYREIWDYDGNGVISDHAEIVDYIQHVIQSLSLIEHEG